MPRLIALLAALLAASTFAPAADAAAKRAPRPGTAATSDSRDSALVGLHDLVSEGGKTCMATHFHFGSSSGLPSKRAAEIEALQSWASFTAWEYGPAWGNSAMAGSRKMSCTGGAGSFSCDFEARPCRRR